MFFHRFAFLLTCTFIGFVKQSYAQNMRSLSLSFDNKGHSLTEIHKTKLDNLLKAMQNPQGIDVELLGLGDGGQDYVLDLGLTQRRAKVVERYLASKEVDIKSFKVTSIEQDLAGGSLPINGIQILIKPHEKSEPYVSLLKREDGRVVARISPAPLYQNQEKNTQGASN